MKSAFYPPDGMTPSPLSCTFFRVCVRQPNNKRRLRGNFTASTQALLLARTSSMLVNPHSTFSMPSWRSVRMPSRKA